MDPSAPSTRASDGGTRALWSAAVLAGAAWLFLAGGGLGPLRQPAEIDPDTVGIPEILTPDGESSSPPTRFHWKPGQEGALAQVVLHGAELEQFWSSAPLRGVDELIIPIDVYEGKGAGIPLFWRVREVWRGRPAGGSGWREFKFRVDSRGYREGEAPTLYDFIE